MRERAPTTVAHNTWNAPSSTAKVQLSNWVSWREGGAHSACCLTLHLMCGLCMQVSLVRRADATRCSTACRVGRAGLLHKQGELFMADRQAVWDSQGLLLPQHMQPIEPLCGQAYGAGAQLQAGVLPRNDSRWGQQCSTSAKLPEGCCSCSDSMLGCFAVLLCVQVADNPPDVQGAVHIELSADMMGCSGCSHKAGTPMVLVCGSVC